MPHPCGVCSICSAGPRPKLICATTVVMDKWGTQLDIVNNLETTILTRGEGYRAESSSALLSARGIIAWSANKNRLPIFAPPGEAPMMVGGRAIGAGVSRDGNNGAALQTRASGATIMPRPPQQCEGHNATTHRKVKLLVFSAVQQSHCLLVLYCCHGQVGNTAGYVGAHIVRHLRPMLQSRSFRLCMLHQSGVHSICGAGLHPKLICAATVVMDKCGTQLDITNNMEKTILKTNAVTTCHGNQTRHRTMIKCSVHTAQTPMLRFTWTLSLLKQKDKSQLACRTRRKHLLYANLYGHIYHAKVQYVSIYMVFDWFCVTGLRPKLILSSTVVMDQWGTQLNHLCTNAPTMAYAGPLLPHQSEGWHFPLPLMKFFMCRALVVPLSIKQYDFTKHALSLPHLAIEPTSHLASERCTWKQGLRLPLRSMEA